MKVLINVTDCLTLRALKVCYIQIEEEQREEPLGDLGVASFYLYGLYGLYFCDNSFVSNKNGTCSFRENCPTVKML